MTLQTILIRATSIGLALLVAHSAITAIASTFGTVSAAFN